MIIDTKSREPQRFDPTLKGDLASVDLWSWEDDWNGFDDEYDRWQRRQPDFNGSVKEGMSYFVLTYT